MDGRIGEKIDNNPVPGFAVSESGENTAVESGVPARKAELDSSSKKTKTCSVVTPKLNKPFPPRTLPDRARIVSPIDSSLQKTPHAFDFRFVASDDEVRQLLSTQTADERRDVTVISHPDDLSQANLVTRLSISKEGRHTLRSGKLFESSKPLTLVMDIRKLTGDELPRFNDLLDPDNPCLYDKVSQKKRPLGEHVSLFVVAAPKQLASVGQREVAAGPDFWRRINRPDNTWQFDAQTGNDSSMIIAEVPPVVPEFTRAKSTTEDDNTVLIDCHLHSHWRQLLLGGPGVDKQGRIQHLPGRLESLKAGQRVILKGANWEDLAFEQTLRQMLAQKCFESNGKICPLPDNVQFYQMPVGNNELHSLFQSLSRSHDKEHASRNPVIINQSNIAQWLSPIAITPEGYAIPNTCLLEQVRAGGAVTVTSPLTEALWFRLLGSLQTLREMTGLEPRLQVADSKRQPKVLGLTENDEVSLSCPKEKTRDHAPVRTVTYQQPAQASHWINKQPDSPLVIQVNEQTSFSQLFDNIHITSEQKAHFGHRQTKLQEVLTAGKPVILLGLENNPTLQQLLEPLMVGQPLLVNGQLQDYPKARVTILWPEFVKSPSSIFHATVATGEPCPEVDLWDINARKYDIARTKLPEQALKQLYKAFKTVPAHLCSPLPEITAGLLNNLIMAARRAQQADHSMQLLPRHWRKAINSVITHGTRQHPSVRDFMKVACWHLLPDKTPDEDQAASVDPDQLAAIINSAPRLDRKFVWQNLWPLARAFDPAVFKDTGFKELQLTYENPFRQRGATESLNRLCTIIVAHGPEHKRDALAYQLKVDLVKAEPWQSLAIRPGRQIKRLQDALASGWQLLLPSGQTRSDAIHALASDCFHMSRTANAEAEGIERIQHRLSESLEWQGSADIPLSALARDLYHGEMSQEDRESRRLSRLHDRLTDSPVIFLEGETGTGKSYFSAKMAKASGQALVISLGPSDSEQTLMKRWQWQQHGDGDRSMAEQNRALMEWANTKSDKDGEYITLVLDEANLAEAGLLASLNGLWEPQPCIYVNGHPVRVSPKHRVILTGNPDHYAGRQMDPALKEKLPRAYYPRLDQAFLRDRVVEPALLNHLQRHKINDIAHSASKSVMALWQYYQELLPEHEFTPRDLTDICSWVGWYLDRVLSEGDGASCEQVNSLIQQSFRDVLGPEITETQQDALSALEIWFAAHYHPDNTLRDRVHNHTLPDIQRDFEAFTKEFRPEFDTSSSAVIELVQRLGQDLSRCQQAYHHDRKHGGRQATLIEGPAGRGKDATLNLVIESVRQQARQRQESMPEVSLLNACDCSWEQLCETIRKAKVDGGIVVISEMNLIDSQHLEGELNDILAGDAHPGFHLFATINPPEYSGRKPLSPALKGRFRHLPIRQYNSAELQTIAGKVLPDSPKGKFVAERLTEKHCRLRACLQRKDLPLQPTSRDLQNVAMAVKSGGDFSEKALHQCLNQHYRLYLMAANLSLEELSESPALDMGKGTLDSGLCQWFNKTVPDIDRPWLIRLSNLDSIDEKKHEIRVKARPNKEEVKAEIIKRMAQAKWQASGLSLKPDESDDVLIQALYRHWQQRWFAHKFCETVVDANSVFPLTEEQQQTLKLPTSQPYLQEADQRIEAWNSDAVQWWPAFWHQISNLPSHQVDDHSNEALAVGSDKAPEKYRLKARSKLAKLLKWRKSLKGPESRTLPIRQPDPQALKQRTNNKDLVSKTSPIRQPDPQALKQRKNNKGLVSKTSPIRQPDPQALKQRTNNKGLASKTSPIRQPDPQALKQRTNDKGPVSSTPPGVWSSPAVLDQRTNYENLELPQIEHYKIFKPQNQSSHMFRSALRDINVTAWGDVELTFLEVQYIEGVETLRPDPFTECDQEVTLASNQTLANFSVLLNKEHLIVLPSLTFNDYIVALRMKPFLPFKLVRDRYTGLHIVLIPEGEAGQALDFVYVVERREPGRKTLPEEARPERLTNLDARCSEGMKTVLNKLFKTIEKQPTLIQVPLQKIKDAEDTEQRIEAITNYCRQFSGKARPASHKNFFKFLVTQRQGSCRHRTPVFVAFCRYFGIPSRQVNSLIHSFAEYSVDEGQTWVSVDLGGAPVEKTDIEYVCQTTTNVSHSSTELKKHKAFLKDLMKGADLTQQQTLAEVCDMSRVELNNALETNRALPEAKLIISNIIGNLWEKRDLISFSLAVSIIVSLGKEALGDYEEQLKPISKAVKRIILYRDDKQRVIEQLKLLHSKIINQGDLRAHDWFSSMREILKDSDLTKPSVIRFALEVLKLGWLDPILNDEKYIEKADKHHRLLVRLKSVDELRVEATHCLKKWYKQLFFREKNSQLWQKAYEDFQTYEDFQRREGTSFVDHCYDGFSSFLEYEITNRLLKNAWTDEPEGIPNIERMLSHQPAFPRSISGRGNHRPVIILGAPSWEFTSINKKVGDLLQIQYAVILERNGRVDVDPLLLTKKFEDLIQKAFSHYLYQLTHSKGGCLTYCWADAYIKCCNERYSYGAHDPSSPEELYVMMSETQGSKLLMDSPSRLFVDFLKDDYLRQALNADNALVLKSDELTTIAEEFLKSLDLVSLSHALET
ncbi:AAA family ATPase [Endozoicomonas sp. 8E]|uniref:AAA family ATPase n=1 Tax=Endozoicomonas sp. 8E TaxID=3035692 RepID=UPI002938D429|nr:AAA family ATPase [Endozoicomonas sp. 8E]WOG28853.1 AAA family ATPase [Endozoicomonas sp. 8E]